jgi:hypothetical protein
VSAKKKFIKAKDSFIKDGGNYVKAKGNIETAIGNYVNAKWNYERAKGSFNVAKRIYTVSSPNIAKDRRKSEQDKIKSTLSAGYLYIIVCLTKLVFTVFELQFANLFVLWACGTINGLNIFLNVECCIHQTG